MDCSSQCHKKNLDTRRNHPSSFFLPFFFQVMLGMRALAVCLLVATCSVEKQLAIDMCQIRRDCGYTVYLGGLLPLTVITTIRKKSLQKLTCYCYGEEAKCLPGKSFTSHHSSPKISDSLAKKESFHFQSLYPPPAVARNRGHSLGFLTLGGNSGRVMDAAS